MSDWHSKKSLVRVVVFGTESHSTTKIDLDDLVALRKLLQRYCLRLLDKLHPKPQQVG